MNVRLIAPAVIFSSVVLGSGLAYGHSQAGAPTLSVRSQVRDLQPGLDAPTDHARSRLVLRVSRRWTQLDLSLSGLDRSAAGRRFGAHLHTGPCVAGNGGAAGPHYNQDVLDGVTPPETSPNTEVWLDFTVTRRGTAHARTAVPFAVTAGDRAVVIHELPTAADGTAGARAACLPVVW